MPLVRVLIGGRPTSMLLDTGASAHLLGGWFARGQKLPLAPSPRDVAVDHDGNPVVLQRTQDTEVVIEGWPPLPDRDWLVTELPTVFEERDVAGILSPQLLVGHGLSIVLDLRHGELRREPAGEERRDGDALPGGCSLAQAPVRRCTGQGPDNGSGPVYAIEADVEGRASVLVVDTGSTSSDLLSGSDASAALEARVTDVGRGAFTLSESAASKTVTGVHLRIGECSWSARMDLVRGTSAESCAHDGNIGMDLLRRCRLDFDFRGMSVRCEP
jgi:hypothetical protein